MKVRLGNIELEYTDEGRGLPVLFVHGYPLNKGMWEYQRQALSSGYRVITVDLRGHGDSQGMDGTASMDSFADDLKALLDHLGIDRAVVVGFSMGGYLTFAFYRKYPDKVRALVLADTRPQADTPEAAEGRRNTAKSVLESRSVQGVIDGMLPRLLTPATAEGNKDLVQRVQAIMGSTPPETVAADLEALASRADSQPTMAQISCPTLVIVGDQDNLTPVADSELMAREIKGAKLVKVPGAAHMSPMEQPDAFNQALREFLDGLK